MSAGQPLTAVLQCACKSVQLEVEGVPTFQVLCWCHDCAKWNQHTPFASVIFPTSMVTVTAGEENISTLNLKNKELNRTFCKECGFRLYNQHEGYAYWSLPAFSLETFKHTPQAHVFCKDADPEALSRFKDDGLVKFEDRPPVAGGTGKIHDMAALAASV